MAGGSAKRTLDGNRRAFRQLTQIHAGITGIALLGRWLGHSFPTTLGDMVLLVLPHVVIAMLTNRLYGMARPVFNEYGKLDDAGVNLNDRGGTMPYYWDLIYLSWFCILASMYTYKVYWIYLVIPGTALYKVWTTLVMPVIGMVKRSGFGSSKPPAGSSESAQTDAQKARRERRAEKRRTVHVR